MIECYLQELLTSTRFVEQYWRRNYLHERRAFNPCDLPSVSDMWESVASGLLTPPYIVAVADGRRSEGGDLVAPLRTGGYETTTFISEPRLRDAFALGSTVKFNQLHDWHPRLRDITNVVAESTCSVTEAFAFLSPPGHRALRAHTDGSHVLVLQLEGRKQWQIAEINSTSPSGEGLYHDGSIPTDEVIELELQPGDLFYMPHGTPHQALAQSEDSFHLAITIEEPSPTSYLDELVDDFSKTDEWRELEAAWLHLSNQESALRANELLRKFIQRITSGAKVHSTTQAGVIEEY